MSQTHKIIGLDVGIASIGSCFLNMTAEIEHIEGLYVRTFDKAENPKTGESLNMVRRESRGTRRRLRRRALRLREARTAMGKVLDTEPDELLSQFKKLDPWALRAIGLDEPLSDVEFCAAIYHLIKLRGFQSNRKAEAQDKEAGQVLSAISVVKQKLEETGCRTLGELAASGHELFKTRKRNRRGEYVRIVDRKDIESEFRLLFEAQRSLGESSSPWLNPELEKALHEKLMRRRPTASGADILEKVGFCSLEPTEKRIAKACYSFERFAWVSKLNNLKIDESGIERALTDDERAKLLEYPFSKTSLTFKQARKALGLPDEARFNLCRYSDGVEAGEKAKLFEATAFHKIRKSLEKPDFDALRNNPGRLDLIGHILTVYKTDEDITAELTEAGFEARLIDALLNLSFDKFASLSQKAIGQLLPHIEAGLRVDEAIKEAGYSSAKNNAGRQRLPKLTEAIPNPVVARAMNQAIKVINAILKRHGLPDAIHVELGRDVGRNFKDRSKVEKLQAENRKSKEAAREKFRNQLKREPRNTLEVRIYQMYLEQDGKCLYSGEPLAIERLFETGYVDIDHALPFSRTLDDSLSNKVLVKSSENRRKGNRTPFEYFGANEDSQKWHEFSVLVNSTAGLSFAKKRKLLKKSLGDVEDFLARNLNDTRYFARLLKNHIESNLLNSQGQPMRVVPVSGQITAFLRARWGLLKIREAGDKHHALDAAVVAATTRGLIQRVTRYSKRKELSGNFGEDYIDFETGEVLDLEGLRDLENQFPRPYEQFRDEVKARLSNAPKMELAGLAYYQAHPSELDRVKPLRVSRAPRRLGLGQAHQETVRSIGKNGQDLADGVVYTKTPINKLKLKDLERIKGFNDPRNAGLIRVLRERLEDAGDNPQKAFLDDQPVYRPSKPGKTSPPIYSVMLADSRATTGIILPKKQGLANNGDMVRVDIYQLGKKYVGVPVYVHQIAGESPRAYARGGVKMDKWDEVPEDQEPLFRLYKNSFLRITKKNDEVIEGYFRAFDIANAQVEIATHDRDPNIGKDGIISSIGIATLYSMDLLQVSVLGDLYRTI